MSLSVGSSQSAGDSRNSLGKSSLADLVWDRISVVNTSIKRREVDVVVSLLLNHLEDALAQKKTVKIRGFGTFEVKKRKGRINTRNPKTGILCQVKDRYSVIFRPSQKLKQSIQTRDPDI